MSLLAFLETIQDDELRSVLPTAVVSMSVATVITVGFMIWFMDRYVFSIGDHAPHTRSTSVAASGTTTSAEIVTSLVADIREQALLLEQQKNIIERLQTRCSDLEGAFRDLKLRLSEPQVPVTYQATSPGALRYSRSREM